MGGNLFSPFSKQMLDSQRVQVSTIFFEAKISIMLLYTALGSPAQLQLVARKSTWQIPLLDSD